MKKIKSEFAQLLKKARDKAAMSQAHLARISRVSTRTIVALENAAGEADRVREDVVIRLALALGEDVEAWLQLWQYRLDVKKIARLKRQLKDNASETSREPGAIGMFRELLDEERSLKERAEGDEGRWQVWVVESKEPTETEFREAVEVVKANISSGIIYRYFFPLAPDNSTLPEMYWGNNPAQAVPQIRQIVVDELRIDASLASERIKGHGVRINEFPLFLFNSSTVVHWREGWPPAAQACYRVVNINEPENAWYYRWEPRAAKEIIRFLESKINGT